MQLSVIIINYNVKYFLEQCVLSVQKAMEKIEGEIIVVDNNSTDGSRTFLEENFKEINFIWNENNEGFAKANNDALKTASGEYILFLNPDTIVPGDCFEKCISFIRSEQNKCALGIKMLDGAGNFLKESKRAFPSPMTSLYKLSGLSRFFPHSKTFAKYHLGYLSENENHEVDVLAGAFMMIPKKILDTIGGFDEDFFMYGEDIDLSFRMQEAGFKNIYFAENNIIHFKGESTKKGSLNYVKMFYKAMSIFVRKHYGNTKAGFFTFLIHIAIFFRGALSAMATFLRSLFLPFQHNVYAKKDHFAKEIKSTLIAGSEEEFLHVLAILKNAAKAESVLGRIETAEGDFSNCVGKLGNLKRIFKIYRVKEIIFCEGQLSFKSIIEKIVEVPDSISIKYFAKGSHSIIGSDDKDNSGEIISNEEENA